MFMGPPMLLEIEIEVHEARRHRSAFRRWVDVRMGAAWLQW